MKKTKLTVVSLLHYFRLGYRTVLFIILLCFYIQDHVHGGNAVLTQFEKTPVIILIIWIVFVVEMILRFFPSKFESPGCQKQFARKFIETGKTDIRIPGNNTAVLILLGWVSFNMIFGALHMAGVMDDGMMILLCAAFSVCDVVCILFFCPFQTWVMKNKCCSTCRIYCWDYAMMFTPLFFVRRTYLWTLLALALILMIRWEITLYRHPERFSENTNGALHCANCTEKLCVHKKQLVRLRGKLHAEKN